MLFSRLPIVQGVLRGSFYPWNLYGPLPKKRGWGVDGCLSFSRRIKADGSFGKQPVGLFWSFVMFNRPNSGISPAFITP